MDAATEIRLTRYSHGAGCGCKIAPKVLDAILATEVTRSLDPGLLVGNEERDDAAVYDLGDGTAVVSTTDFFMPIVDDPEDFGRIASVNAMSDVYAMGGTPLVAISILGWPVSTVPIEAARRVIEGAREACADAGIPLAGGHSIDSPEPIFGLAVTGRVRVEHIKRNGGGRAGDTLYLTKPLGVGILTTAEKKGKLRPEHARLARDCMIRLNKIGAILGEKPWVRAMTDVTGFGLLGHLSEMCAASDLGARIHFDRVPLLDPVAVNHYLAEKCVPGGTLRNWDSYGHVIGPLDEATRNVLCDPQTSGGLLVAVDPDHARDFEDVLLRDGTHVRSIGELVPAGEHRITVV